MSLGHAISMKRICMVGVGLLVLGTWALSGWAADDTLTDDEMVIKRERGHRLLLPKDWPIDEKGAQVTPVSVETYLSMKFGQVRERFASTDQHLEVLNRRVQQLEEERKALLIRLQRLEEHAAQQDQQEHEAKAQTSDTQEVTHGDATQVR